MLEASHAPLAAGSPAQRTLPVDPQWHPSDGLKRGSNGADMVITSLGVRMVMDNDGQYWLMMVNQG